MSLYSDKKNLLLLLMLICIQQLSGQITPLQENQLWLKADKAFEHGDFLTAMTAYDQLYKIDSNNQELNYKLGVSNFKLKKYKMNSKKYFDKVKAADFPETWFYLGELNHLLRNNDLAEQNLIAYKNSPNQDEKEHGIKEIDNLIAKSHTARLFESQVNNNIQIESLGSTINTEYSEYAPLIPVDEDFIIFTSRRANTVYPEKDPLGEYFEDIYMSSKFGDIWQDPQMLNTSINTPLHDACTGLSADGERLLIYRTSKDLSGGDIYESALALNKFGNPVILNSNLNSGKYIESSACYSQDNNTIFFSSNRPGGYGGMDLYMMKKLPNGNWAMPFNLGPTINTEFNEDAPFVHPSGSVLFFSSEGHTNMGGYDIMRSNFDELNNFSEPSNMGYPINTRDDDIFFVLNTDATTGYFSSERPGGMGSQDIYKVRFSPDPLPLNVYAARVMDENNNPIKKAEITVTDLSTKSIYGTYKSNESSGKIVIVSEPNKEYQIIVKALGYEPYITNIILTSDNELSYRLTKHAQ